MAKRFYKHVTVSPLSSLLGKDAARTGAEGGYAILLDGKPVKTPARTTLAVPSRALAEAIAEEWRGQGETLDPASMHLTRLANTAIDLIAVDRGKIANQIVSYGRSDLLAYRAEEPQALIASQAEQWNPLLEWLEQRYGVQLVTGSGIGFVEQPADTLLALEKAVYEHDDFTLAALHNAATITGSLVLALALAAARLNAEAAGVASALDETFQAEKWAQDAQAESRRNRLASQWTNAFLVALAAHMHPPCIQRQIACRKLCHL